MAALALVGAVTVGCSSDDNIIDTPQQPANTDNVVTLTTTVGFDEGAEARGATRALSNTGVKTFAEGDKIAVIYKNTSGETVKAVSEAISSGAGTKSATFTVTLTNPDKNAAIRYIYPAAMAKETIATDATMDDDGTVDFNNLNSQDGLLATLGSKYDLCTWDAGSWGGDALFNVTLTNKLAILAITLKDSEGYLNGTITTLSLSDGTYSYAYIRDAADSGPIYMAIRPTNAAAIEVTANASNIRCYRKSLTNKTYEASNGYNVTWRMTQLAPGALAGKFTINGSGGKVYFSKGNLQANYDVGWNWTFSEYQWDYVGNNSANINIDGNGSLNVSGSVYVDLFGWVGASSDWTGVAQYGISNSTTSGYGNNASEALKSDWGTLAIYNGSNTANSGWRTLTTDEWQYVFNTRASGSTVNGTSNARYTHATINTDRTSVNGMILFPDGITVASSEATSWGTINGNSDWGTKCTFYQWRVLAAKGCVFLPAAGGRNGYTVYDAGTYAGYWSSSPNTPNVNHAYSVRFSSNYLAPANDDDDRYSGFSVRLVRPVE